MARDEEGRVRITAPMLRKRAADDKSEDAAAAGQVEADAGEPGTSSLKTKNAILLRRMGQHPMKN